MVETTESLPESESWRRFHAAINPLRLYGKRRQAVEDAAMAYAHERLETEAASLRSTSRDSEADDFAGERWPEVPPASRDSEVREAAREVVRMEAEGRIQDANGAIEDLAAILDRSSEAAATPHRHRYGLVPVWKADRSAVESWWWCTDHPTGEWVKIEDDPEAAECIPASEAAPVVGLSASEIERVIREYVTPLNVTGPKHMPNGYEWPARCTDCGLVTEDPDAYVGEDEEVTPEKVCPITGTWHAWANTADGLIRFFYPADLAARLTQTRTLGEAE